MLRIINHPRSAQENILPTFLQLVYSPESPMYRAFPAFSLTFWLIFAKNSYNYYNLKLFFQEISSKCNGIVCKRLIVSYLRQLQKSQKCHYFVVDTQTTRRAPYFSQAGTKPLHAGFSPSTRRVQPLYPPGSTSILSFCKCCQHKNARFYRCSIENECLIKVFARKIWEYGKKT